MTNFVDNEGRTVYLATRSQSLKKIDRCSNSTCLLVIYFYDSGDRRRICRVAFERRTLCKELRSFVLACFVAQTNATNTDVVDQDLNKVKHQQPDYKRLDDNCTLRSGSKNWNSFL